MRCGNSEKLGFCEQLASLRKLAAYRHDGYWQCMDTQYEREFLEQNGKLLILHGKCGNDVRVL